MVRFVPQGDVIGKCTCKPTERPLFVLLVRTTCAKRLLTKHQAEQNEELELGETMSSLRRPGPGPMFRLS